MKTPGGVGSLTKRVFDFGLSLIGIFVLSPLMLMIAIFMKLSSPGPILYVGTRMGRFGKPFRLYKFRTMVVNAEQIGGPSTSEDDPRVTKIGRLLRKYKLDELPQLINVLKSEMSLVGPRPEVVSEVELYTSEERRLLSVLPGITDWASVLYHNEGEILRGAADPHEAYRRLIRPGKIRLGLEYVRTHSFSVDLRILAATLRTLVSRRTCFHAFSRPGSKTEGNLEDNEVKSSIAQALTLNDLKSLAQRTRVEVLHMIHRAQSSHLGSSFSMIDLLVVLYGRILHVDPKRPDWKDRDRLILSKGHACAGLYAILAERGFFPREWLETFYQNGSLLAGHITHKHVPGVEASTGSLGHGLPIATGMALAGKNDGRTYRVFAIVSDGECDEGSTWEAVLFSGHHRLDNLVAIVDYNKIQSIGRVEEVLNLEPFADKWKSCQWAVREIDGHNFEEIDRALSCLPLEPGRPSCLIAHTVKGKGVSFMEGKLLWHYRSPNKQELATALAELEKLDENRLYPNPHGFGVARR
jgi:transketolase